jgi:hypothetical protein
MVNQLSVWVCCNYKKRDEVVNKEKWGRDHEGKSDWGRYSGIYDYYLKNCYIPPQYLTLNTNKSMRR